MNTKLISLIAAVALMTGFAGACRVIRPRKLDEKNKLGKIMMVAGFGIFGMIMGYIWLTSPTM